MYAIIDIGGKQYKAEVGDVLYLEKLKAKLDSDYVIDRVIAFVDDKSCEFGEPFLKGAKVILGVVKQGKRKKIRVFKYKPKKNYSRRYGHRQSYSKVVVKEIKAS